MKTEWRNIFFSFYTCWRKRYRESSRMEKCLWVIQYFCTVFWSGCSLMHSLQLFSSLLLLLLLLLTCYLVSNVSSTYIHTHIYIYTHRGLFGLGFFSAFYVVCKTAKMAAFKLLQKSRVSKQLTNVLYPNAESACIP